jgi:hypothetical protein
LSHPEYGEEVQERRAQIAFTFNLLLPRFPAQRQRFSKQGTKIVAMPVIVRQGVNNTCELLYALFEVPVKAAKAAGGSRAEIDKIIDGRVSRRARRLANHQRVCLTRIGPWRSGARKASRWRW